MIEKINTILFDLDGTLTDPKAGIVNSILFALKQLDIIENKVHELDAFIGPPLRDSFRTRYVLTDTVADEAVKAYREYFAVTGLFENELYPGMKNVLQTLTSRNYRLFVATSKPTIFAEQIIRHFNIDEYFQGVVGSNLDNTRTDKTQVIAHVINTFGLTPATISMVGDRKFDILGAKNNFINSVGVTYGYGTHDEIAECSPDYIIHHCTELTDIFSDIHVK